MATTIEQARCATIEEVITRMTSLGERMEAQYGPRDGVLCFNRLYLAVTKGVKRAAARKGYFCDERSIAQLDVMFAQFYFDAVDAVEAGEQAPTLSWRVLFEHRDRPGVLPIQFAVAGMNAHINHDLPLALLEQWAADGARPGDDSPAFEEYTNNNRNHKQEETTEMGRLEPADLKQLERELGTARLDAKLALFVVEAARSAAWTSAHLLWDVRHVHPARAAWLATTDHLVGAAGRVLLEPV
jgi:hypothetical protein